MSKKTGHQRLLAQCQPYTYTHSAGGPDAGVHVVGRTPEQKFNHDTEEWDLVWEEHDLGTSSTLDEAKAVAAEWRANLVGVY